MKKIFFFIIIALSFVACTSEGGRKHDNPNTQNTDKQHSHFESKQNKLAVNVYIENSGSMAGYVNGYTDFKDAVGNYLTDIQISGISNSLNLFFINKRADRINTDINTYLTRLTTSCNASTSDIAKIFKLVLTNTTGNQISIFVTDGIFSPEKRKNAVDYLKEQQKDIKEDMANYLKTYPNTTVTVYHLSSRFNGIYYNCTTSKKWTLK